jgi:hypothetical protein
MLWYNEALMPGRRRPIRVGPYTNIHREPEGWLVSVCRRGRNFAEYLGDAVWGGREKALLAAQRYRDGLLQRIPADTRIRRRPPKGRRSRTGVPGVSYERYVVDGRVYHRYIGHWQDPDDGPQRRRFLVERYGSREARALAIEARTAGVADIEARLLARQREEATKRLRTAAPMPRQVKDPRSRKGINMGRRRPRGSG